jgi:hypothetical protein
MIKVGPVQNSEITEPFFPQHGKSTPPHEKVQETIDDATATEILRLMLGPEQLCRDVLQLDGDVSPATCGSLKNLESMKESESGSTTRVPAVLNRTDHLRNEQRLRESFPQFGSRRRNSCSASHRMQDVGHDSVYITVRGNECIRPGLADDVLHVTLRWTDVKECSVGR